MPISWAIVGVQKAATSTLYGMICKHHLITRAGEKELHFFDREATDWDRPDYRDYSRLARYPHQVSAGDGTPSYLFWPRALERMQRYRPQMRLIAVFRDPIERAASQWAMQRHRRDYPSLPETVDLFPTRLLPMEIPPGTRPLKFRGQQQYTRGLYGQQLRRGFDLFDREQWLLLDFHDVTRRPARILDRVVDHVGLPAFGAPPAPRHAHKSPVEQHGPSLTADHVQWLAEGYAEDLAEFADLSGLDISHWPTWQVARGDLTAAEFAERIARKLGLG